MVIKTRGVLYKIHMTQSIKFPLEVFSTLFSPAPASSVEFSALLKGILSARARFRGHTLNFLSTLPHFAQIHPGDSVCFFFFLHFPADHHQLLLFKQWASSRSSAPEIGSVWHLMGLFSDTCEHKRAGEQRADGSPPLFEHCALIGARKSLIGAAV